MTRPRHDTQVGQAKAIEAMAARRARKAAAAADTADASSAAPVAAAASPPAAIAAAAASAAPASSSKAKVGRGGWCRGTDPSPLCGRSGDSFRVVGSQAVCVSSVTHLSRAVCGYYPLSKCAL